MAIKLKTTEWREGSIKVYGQRHTIHTDAVGVGAVTLVFERDPRAGKFWFRGVERSENNPASQFAGDLPPIVKSLGSDAVAKATWLRLYRDDAQRRSHWD